MFPYKREKIRYLSDDLISLCLETGSQGRGRTLNSFHTLLTDEGKKSKIYVLQDIVLNFLQILLDLPQSAPEFNLQKL